MNSDSIASLSNNVADVYNFETTSLNSRDNAVLAQEKVVF